MKSIKFGLFNHLYTNEELREGLIEPLNIFGFVDILKGSDGLERVVRVTYPKLLYYSLITPIFEIYSIPTF